MMHSKISTTHGSLRLFLRPTWRFSVALLASVMLWACKPANDTANNSANETAVAKPAIATQHADLRAAGLVEGTHYKTIARPLAAIPGKVSVREFFWYGCPHCEAFEPTLHAWQRSLPAHVEFKQVPAVWAKPMQLHGKAFFIAEALPGKQELHAELFKLIIGMQRKTSLDKQREMLAAVFDKYGLAKDEFLQQLKAAATENQLQQAMADMKRAGVQSTPTLIVNGRYLVLNKTAQKPEDITAIADKLIALETERLRVGK
ncbi:MAG: thiol:disulfide interchange protein DsbA/DsbL [Pseudomonadales bacterium]|nr:thiol:disulfide interchange protein DsbA/DsbL [Pseudomonadales bacterium]